MTARNHRLLALVLSSVMIATLIHVPPPAFGQSPGDSADYAIFAKALADQQAISWSGGGRLSLRFHSLQ